MLSEMLMIIGTMIFLCAFPLTILMLAVFVLKKKRIWIPVLCMILSVLISVGTIGVGGYLYGESEEYQKQVMLTPEEKQLRKENAEQLEREKEKAKADSAKKEKATKKEFAQEYLFNEPKSKVKYIEYSIEKNSNGVRCLVLGFEYTNISSKNQVFDTAFTVDVFKGEIKLEESSTYTGDAALNGRVEIQPGSNVKVAKCFILGEERESECIKVELASKAKETDRRSFEIVLDKTTD